MLAKTDRELRLEKVLETSLLIIEEYSQMSIKSLGLMVEPHRSNLVADLERTAEGAASFIEKGRKILGEK